MINSRLKRQSNSNHSQEKAILLVLLENHLQAAELQIARICRDQKREAKVIKAIKKGVFVKDHKALPILFADIHFFLIAISNIGKTYFKLKNLKSRDEAFVLIYKKYDAELERLDTFRDHLEHIIEGGIRGVDKKGKPLMKPGDLGNLYDGNFSFGGETFNLTQSFQLVKRLIRDLAV